MTLTKKANAYREHVKKIVSLKARDVIFFRVGKEEVYSMDLMLYFDKLENPGWFERWPENLYFQKDSKDGKHKKGELKERKGQRKAKTRYKELDYDNRIKFLQDCVVKAIGINSDAQIFGGRQEKHEDTGNPRAEVIIRIDDRNRFFHGG